MTGYAKTRRRWYGQAVSTGSTAIVGTNNRPAYFVATASAATGAASRKSGQRDAAVRTMIHDDSASRNRQVASKVAKLPRKVMEAVAENSRLAQTATRSLKSRRLIPKSSAVVASISRRLTARAAARPPTSLAAAPRTG